MLPDLKRGEGKDALDDLDSGILHPELGLVVAGGDVRRGNDRSDGGSLRSRVGVNDVAPHDDRSLGWQVGRRQRPIGSPQLEVHLHADVGEVLIEFAGVRLSLELVRHHKLRRDEGGQVVDAVLQVKVTEIRNQFETGRAGQRC